ncbi:TetR/AcrR family transcriptional regulator [Synechocystis sp. PCC 6714]|uniref:TetR/AcrR family transcriptional regulator n=1 Tax=Synechocystis sp. (strain PCC 6714) TaxID=1147 RepID=UPI00041E8842|nr:TetR/AcrR family transcriptional regulator [Synechocystis sp. PCC 6714]
MPKDNYLPCLLQLFRQYGYDGATLSKIAAATGLGKASLYHHFPGGKEEMMTSVLAYVEGWLDKNLLPSLQGDGTAQLKLQRMGDRLLELYEGGEQPCLFAILLSGSARDTFHAQVQRLFETWIVAIAKVLMAEGIEEKVAKQKAEKAVILVQGSLILSQGLNDIKIFKQTIDNLPTELLLS